MVAPSRFPHFRGLPGLWDLISWVSRNPRRREVRPSLCPLAGHPPSDPQLLQVNDTLNFIPGQECNLVVQGWRNWRNQRMKREAWKIHLFT